MHLLASKNVFSVVWSQIMSIGDTYMHDLNYIREWEHLIAFYMEVYLECHWKCTNMNNTVNLIISVSFIKECLYENKLIYVDLFHNVTFAFIGDSFYMIFVLPKWLVIPYQINSIFRVCFDCWGFIFCGMFDLVYFCSKILSSLVITRPILIFFKRPTIETL